MFCFVNINGGEEPQSGFMLCFARLEISLDLSHGILESLTLVNTRIRGQGFQFSDWSKWPPSQPSYWLF